LRRKKTGETRAVNFASEEGEKERTAKGQDAISASLERKRVGKNFRGGNGKDQGERDEQDG